MFWSFFPKLLLADPPGGVWLLTYFLGRVTDLLFRELLLPPPGGLKHSPGWEIPSQSGVPKRLTVLLLKVIDWYFKKRKWHPPPQGAS